MFHSAISASLGAQVAISGLGGYVLGSIPFGLIAARLGGVGDIRAIGSGNIGATNVLRSGRRDLALITLVGDAGKGALSVLAAAALFGPLMACLAGGAAFVGHLFPLWLRFRGGKGVATFFGVLFALVWPVGLAAGATWLVVAALFRFSSLAALAAAACAPIWLVILERGGSGRLELLLSMAALIVVSHRANIGRLLRRAEPRIGAKTAIPG